MSATPAERSSQARAAAFQSWANTKDRSARTAAARRAADERFEQFADPEAARRAHFARMRANSMKARRKNRTSR